MKYHKRDIKFGMNEITFITYLLYRKIRLSILIAIIILRQLYDTVLSYGTFNVTLRYVIHMCEHCVRETSRITHPCGRFVQYTY